MVRLLQREEHVMEPCPQVSGIPWIEIGQWAMSGVGILALLALCFLGYQWGRQNSVQIVKRTPKASQERLVDAPQVQSKACSMISAAMLFIACVLVVIAIVAVSKAG